jgi:hypothetical protein
MQVSLCVTASQALPCGILHAAHGGHARASVRVVVSCLAAKLR